MDSLIIAVLYPHEIYAALPAVNVAPSTNLFPRSTKMLSLEKLVIPLDFFQRRFQLFARKPHAASTAENPLAEEVSLIPLNSVVTMCNFLAPRQVDVIQRGWKITSRVLSLPFMISAVISRHHFLAPSVNLHICCCGEAGGESAAISLQTAIMIPLNLAQNARGLTCPPCN